jgi:hypothetical protein
MSLTRAAAAFPSVIGGRGADFIRENLICSFRTAVQRKIAFELCYDWSITLGAVPLVASSNLTLTRHARLAIVGEDKSR